LRRRPAIFHAALERAYADLVASFTAVLADANFVELSHAEIEAAHRRRSGGKPSIAGEAGRFVASVSVDIPRNSPGR